MDNSSTSDDRGLWLGTRYGRKYYTARPHPEDVFIDDIAAALSRSCRYGGHTTRHYSVAEHSVRLAWIMRDAGFDVDIQQEALMHDATEAYLCDIPRPVKPVLTNYKELEELNWFAIARRFNLSPELDGVVELADKAFPNLEKNYVMFNQPDYTQTTKPIPDWFPKKMHFVGWPAWLARWMFMREYRRLFC